MNRLREKLSRIDGSGYKAYKGIEGTYKGDVFLLHIDYVQPDPFAPPSRIRVEIPHSITHYSRDWYAQVHRRTAFEDFLAREVSKCIRLNSKDRYGTGKSGLINIDSPGQEILKRTAVKVDAEKTEIRLSLGLPARGRTILGKQASELLASVIPDIAKKALLKFEKVCLQKHLELADNQEYIRSFLKGHGYMCFIANGSILPRASGITNKPLTGERVVPFNSPSSFEVEIPVPHGNPVRGMAIPEGVTLIVGGGYHGKSTFLKAIERGVYNHVQGDGREYVITNDTACKIRAEDGRSIEKVNISPFISNLPFAMDTVKFSTMDASGSTSQAANIIEALEAGSRLLLIDEDTSATNFMIRDARMQELVSREKEPITPFIDRVRQLYTDLGVSTILVLGGSGDYFDVADKVIMMDEYRPVDVTERALQISNSILNRRISEGGRKFGGITQRIVEKQGLNHWSREKIDAKGLSTIVFGDCRIDLSFVEQLVDPSQTAAIALMMDYILKKLSDGSTPLKSLIDKLFEVIESEGLDAVSPYFGKHPGDLAMPREIEVAAAINRLRTLKIK